MTDRMGHRPDLPPPTGWKRWRCTTCAAIYDEQASQPEARRHRCPRCWAGRPHWSVLVESPDGSTPCPDCRAPILWLTTDAGLLMPVDAQPDPMHGNVIRHNNHAGVLSRTKAAATRAAGVPLHVHHRLTCPHADRWAGQKGTSR